MRSPQSEVTSVPKAPATTAGEGPASRARRPAHPRDGLLQLQRRYGNRRAQGIIQAKLNVGPVDDQLEREADRVSRPATASSVGRVPEERTERVSGVDVGAERLYADAGAGRRDAALGTGVSTAGADVFVRRSEYRPGGARGDMRPGHEPTPTVRPGAVQAASAMSAPATTAPAVQRRRSPEETFRHDTHGGRVLEEQHRSLVHKVLRTPGRSLDAPLRAEMEARFGGADFSGVRVHSDAVAQRSAEEIQAKAYTSGPHVVDGGDMSKEDWAHELTHYLDQQAGPVPGTDNGAGLSVSDPSDHGERHAVENARRVMSTAAPVRRMLSEQAEAVGRRAVEGGPAPVQRVVDLKVVNQARQALGIQGIVKIVEVPEGVAAETAFKDYPSGNCVGLSTEDLELSVTELTGYEEVSASEAVAAAGGGGYLPRSGIILVNSAPGAGHTVSETIQHEMGHLKQHESGFNVDQSGGRAALVEYHNMLVNENALTGGMRTRYNDEDESLPSATSKKAQDQGISLANPWEALLGYLPGHDPDGSQAVLLKAIETELEDPKYDQTEGKGMGKRPIRDKIKARIGRKYFKGLFPVVQL
ncbi:DUF4157 domain-containing protein [Streptomyces sp. NBC_00280]|uniref:eCIS core domain-containing protein n=1 Tax=Streptomyces sp. NBC_00280 TaxID=2975699 RepID=UPI003250A58C